MNIPDYNKKVKEHFLHPRNMGEIKNPDGIGKVGNSICGDIMWVYIKVDKKKNIIKDIGFKTMGCVTAIATSSMITELAKGMVLEKAKKITRENVAKSLGGLPPNKMHCSNLAADALHKAIEDYEKKQAHA